MAYNMIIYYHKANNRKGSDTPEVTAAAEAVSVCVGKCGRSELNARTGCKVGLFRAVY